MRFLILLITILLLATTVTAVGMRVPPDLERRTFRVGEKETIQFSVVGGDEEQKIEFYVVPKQKNVLNVGEEGHSLSAEYHDVVTLDPYEIKEFDVEFEGVREENDYFLIEYGFTYINDAEDEGVGIQQAVSLDFEARVKCYGCDDDEDETSSITSSGGGGGGGGLPPSFFENEEGSDNEGISPTVIASEDDVQAQDVASSDGGVDEMSVGGEPRKLTITEIGASTPKALVSKGGKSLLIGVLGMMVLTVMLTMYTIKVVKESDGG